MEKALVSICIPAHNAENTVMAAVQSVLNQCYEPMEVLVLVNGQNQRALEVLHRVDDDRVHVFYQAEEGISVARNALVQKARGTYIAWLDADDIMLPERISKQVAFLENNAHIDMVGSYATLRGSRLRKVKWPTTTHVLHAWLLFKNPLVQSSIMFKRSLNPRYQTAFDYVEDYALLAYNEHIQVSVLPYYLCSYYAPATIATKQKAYKQQEKLDLILHTLIESRNLPKHIDWFLLRDLARGELSAKKAPEAIKHLSYVIKDNSLKPYHGIAYYLLAVLYKRTKNLRAMGCLIRYAYLLPRAITEMPRYR